MEGKQQTTDANLAQERIGKTKVLYLQNLPKTATPAKIATVLQDAGLPFKECNVQINDRTNQCESSQGSISFSSKAECKQ